MQTEWWMFLFIVRSFSFACKLKSIVLLQHHMGEVSDATMSVSTISDLIVLLYKIAPSKSHHNFCLPNVWYSVVTLQSIYSTVYSTIAYLTSWQKKLSLQFAVHLISNLFGISQSSSLSTLQEPKASILKLCPANNSPPSVLKFYRDNHPCSWSWNIDHCDNLALRCALLSLLLLPHGNRFCERPEFRQKTRKRAPLLGL